MGSSRRKQAVKKGESKDDINFMTEVPLDDQGIAESGSLSKIEQATTGLYTIANESKLELVPNTLQSSKKPLGSDLKSHRAKREPNRVVVIKNYQTQPNVTNQEMQTTNSHINHNPSSSDGVEHNKGIKKKSARSSSAENFEEFASDQQIRTPITQINFGVALPKIDIKKINEEGLLPKLPEQRSKSTLRQAAIVGNAMESQGLKRNPSNGNPVLNLSLLPA